MPRSSTQAYRGQVLLVTKEYVKAVNCHPAYLTYMQIISCEMPDWMKLKAGIKIARRNIKNLRYADDTT